MITESSQANHDEEFLENWMKWRLYLSSSADQRVTVYPNTRVSLTNMVSRTNTQHSGRESHPSDISRTNLTTGSPNYSQYYSLWEY